MKAKKFKKHKTQASCGVCFVACLALLEYVPRVCWHSETSNLTWLLNKSILRFFCRSSFKISAFHFPGLPNAQALYIPATASLIGKYEMSSPCLESNLIGNV
jgi:hypothetical protein